MATMAIMVLAVEKGGTALGPLASDVRGAVGGPWRSRPPAAAALPVRLRSPADGCPGRVDRSSGPHYPTLLGGRSSSVLFRHGSVLEHVAAAPRGPRRPRGVSVCVCAWAPAAAPARPAPEGASGGRAGQAVLRPCFLLPKTCYYYKLQPLATRTRTEMRCIDDYIEDRDGKPASHASQPNVSSLPRNHDAHEQRQYRVRL